MPILVSRFRYFAQTYKAKMKWGAPTTFVSPDHGIPQHSVYPGHFQNVSLRSSDQHSRTTCFRAAPRSSQNPRLSAATYITSVSSSHLSPCQIWIWDSHARFTLSPWKKKRHSIFLSSKYHLIQRATSARIWTIMHVAI